MTSTRLASSGFSEWGAKSRGLIKPGLGHSYLRIFIQLNNLAHPLPPPPSFSNGRALGHYFMRFEKVNVVNAIWSRILNPRTWLGFTASHRHIMLPRNKTTKNAHIERSAMWEPLMCHIFFVSFLWWEGVRAFSAFYASLNDAEFYSTKWSHELDQHMTDSYLYFSF